MLRIMLLVLWLPVAQALAEDPARFPGQGPAPQAAPEPETFDIEFAGGTLSDLLAAIEKKTGSPPNVLVDPKVASVSVVPIRLRSVSLNDLLTAVGHITPAIHVGRIARDVFIVRPIASPAKAHTSIVRPYNIEPYLEKYKVEDIVTAMKTAIEMLTRDETASIKFHAETKLLIVAGTLEQVNAAYEVLVRLTAAAQPTEGSSKKP